MRAARLISLVLLLQNRESMTGAELADELEVSERTIHRDVLALNAAGIPVYADRGRAGGYRLLGGYRTRLTGLSRDEADALFLSGLPGPAGEMGLAEVVATARLKVLAALPSGLRDASHRVERRFHLDVPGWFRESEPPNWLAELADAIWQDRPVRLRYQRRDREVERDVEPYGLVLKNGTWYLVARVGLAGLANPGVARSGVAGIRSGAGVARIAADATPGGTGHRTYRVDRITDVTATEQTTFARDESFDLVGYWAGQAERFVRELLGDEITVRLSPAGLHALRYVAAPPAVATAIQAAGTPDQEGWVVTRLPVESTEVAYGQLLSLGPEAEVLAPPELRARLVRVAARLAALYQV